MSDAVLNQILHQLQALQVSQQALQAKVRRIIDASRIRNSGLIKSCWLLVGRQSCHPPQRSTLSELRVWCPENRLPIRVGRIPPQRFESPSWSWPERGHRIFDRKREREELVPFQSHVNQCVIAQLRFGSELIRLFGYL